MLRIPYAWYAFYKRRNCCACYVVCAMFDKHGTIFAYEVYIMRILYAMPLLYVCVMRVVHVMFAAPLCLHASSAGGAITYEVNGPCVLHIPAWRFQSMYGFPRLGVFKACFIFPVLACSKQV